MTIINLTPHPVTLRDPAGEDHVIEPSSPPARVSSEPGCMTDILAEAGGVPVYSAPQWGEVVGLPPARDMVVYVVSALVASRVPDRRDVVYPGTGPADGCVRDAAGRVAAVTRLISAAAMVRDTCIYCGSDCGPVCIATGAGASRSGWDCPQCGGN